MSDTPKCPNCGKSSGLSAEAAVVVQWSRGDWRPRSNPEVLTDASAGCDHCDWTGNVGDCWEQIDANSPGDQP